MWKLCSILRRCKKIALLIVPWIGYSGRIVVADLTQTLNIGHLRFWELSHCRVTDLLLNQLPSKCPLLKFFLLQDCHEITKEVYINPHFKTHGCLTLINVAGNREALSVNCVIELWKYSHRKIMVDVWGNQLINLQTRIVEEHPDAMERIKDIEEYCFMLNWNQLKQNLFCYCFVHSFTCNR